MSGNNPFRTRFFHRAQVVLDNLRTRRLIENGMEAGIDDIFEYFEEQLPDTRNTWGLRTRFKLVKMVLPSQRPEEASDQPFLEIEEKYLLSGASDISVGYRYAVVWRTEIVRSNSNDDYLTGAIIELKRSIRFDWHSYLPAKRPHPELHWHPNGASEVCLPTPPMNPFALAAFGIRCFDHEYYEAQKATFGTEATNPIDGHFFKVFP